jgi:hypothetical protein
VPSRPTACDGGHCEAAKMREKSLKVGVVHAWIGVAVPHPVAYDCR